MAEFQGLLLWQRKKATIDIDAPSSLKLYGSTRMMRIAVRIAGTAARF